jgi:rhodanese-related sulfurtransferase
MNSGDSAVAERLARLLDCRVQPVLEVDESIPLPRALPQFLPRDELPRAFEERDQDLERLLLQAEPGATTEQLTGHRIELESAEAHARGPQGGMHRLACAQCSRGGRTGSTWGQHVRPARGQHAKPTRDEVFAGRKWQQRRHFPGHLEFTRSTSPGYRLIHRRGVFSASSTTAEADVRCKVAVWRLVGTVLIAVACAPLVRAQGPAPGEAASTREITTEALQMILLTGSAAVLDVRPAREFAISHIPGALNGAPKPGVPMSLYVSDITEIGRLVRGNKAAALVLYCNGPHCGKSRRLAAELGDAGYTDVRRYQLGIPAWRAAGGVCQIELDAVVHVVSHDQTAVLIDAREASEVQRGAIARARHIPRSLVLEEKDAGEVSRAKDDGRLPMEDHNTRIVVLGADAEAARYVAEALTREAFHNVSFFAGPFATVQKALIESER